MLSGLGMAGALLLGAPGAHAQGAVDKILPVPYVTQLAQRSECFGPGSRWPLPVGLKGYNNCGFACVAMVADANHLRPPGLTDQDWVQYLRESGTGQPFNCWQGEVNWVPLDEAAVSINLCADESRQRGPLYSWDSVWQALYNTCMPVVVLVRNPTWLPTAEQNMLNHAGHLADHFVVLVGISADREVIYYQNPLKQVINPPDGGIASVSKEDLLASIEALVVDNRYGTTYGSPLGGLCDVNLPNCTGPQPGPTFYYDHVQVAVRRAQPNGQCPYGVRIYWAAGPVGGGDTTFEPRRSTILYGRPDAAHHDFVVVYNLRGRSRFGELLHKLRVDPTEPRSATDCAGEIEWVGLANRMSDYGRWYPFYEMDEDCRPTQELLDWDMENATGRGPDGDVEESQCYNWGFAATSTDPYIHNESIEMQTNLPFRP